MAVCPVRGCSLIDSRRCELADDAQTSPLAYAQVKSTHWLGFCDRRERSNLVVCVHVGQMYAYVEVWADRRTMRETGEVVSAVVCVVPNLVQNLLVLARADEGRMAPNVRALDLADLLFEEVAHVPSYEGVHVDVAGVAPLVVSADCDLLGRAVRNLLANAVRYAATTVRVSCEERGGRVRIVVEDDGKGIAHEQRERAFDRFVRLDAGPLRGQEGTGLGLSACLRGRPWGRRGHTRSPRARALRRAATRTRSRNTTCAIASTRSRWCRGGFARRRPL